MLQILNKQHAFGTMNLLTVLNTSSNQDVDSTIMVKDFLQA